jgi:hypothetical protein
MRKWLISADTDLPLDDLGELNHYGSAFKLFDYLWVFHDAGMGATTKDILDAVSGVAPSSGRLVVVALEDVVSRGLDAFHSDDLGGV